jgi:hypothetical protein
MAEGRENVRSILGGLGACEVSTVRLSRNCEKASLFVEGDFVEFIDNCVITFV